MTFILLGIVSILIIVMIVTIIAMVLTLIAGLFSEVPFVPLAQSVVNEALALLKATDSGTFYDLGSGDGRVVFTFARLYPNARAIGIEVGPLPYLIGRAKNNFLHISNAHLWYRNFFKVPLADADYIYMYLFPAINQRLHEKFMKELKNGARVVVCDFPFNGMEPVTKKVVGSGFTKHTLYLYQF